MAEINQLKPITAPSLTSAGFGQSLLDAFANINSNFQTLAQRDFIQGDKGNGIKLVEIPLTQTVKQQVSPGTSAGYKDITALTKDGAAIVKLIYKTFTGGDLEIDLVGKSIDTVIIQTSNTRGLQSLVNKENKQTSWLSQLVGAASSQVVYKYVITDNYSDDNVGEFAGCPMPYIFFDKRFYSDTTIDDKNLAEYDSIVDTTCMVQLTGYDSTGEPIYEMIKTLPSVYFDSDQGAFCWMFGGQKTGIIAQGPAGRDGINAVTHIFQANSASTGETIIGKAWTGVQFGELTSYQTPIHVGDACIVFLTSANQNNKLFYSRVTSTDGGVKVYIDESMKFPDVVARADLDAFFMEANTGAATLKGLRMPTGGDLCHAIFPATYDESNKKYIGADGGAQYNNLIIRPIPKTSSTIASNPVGCDIGAEKNYTLQLGYELIRFGNTIEINAVDGELMKINGENRNKIDWGVSKTGITMDGLGLNKGGESRPSHWTFEQPKPADTETPTEPETDPSWPLRISVGSDFAFNWNQGGLASSILPGAEENPGRLLVGSVDDQGNSKLLCFDSQCIQAVDTANGGVGMLNIQPYGGDIYIGRSGNDTSLVTFNSDVLFTKIISEVNASKINIYEKLSADVIDTQKISFSTPGITYDESKALIQKNSNGNFVIQSGQIYIQPSLENTGALLLNHKQVHAKHQIYTPRVETKLVKFSSVTRGWTDAITDNYSMDSTHSVNLNVNDWANKSVILSTSSQFSEARRIGISINDILQPSYKDLYMHRVVTSGNYKGTLDKVQLVGKVGHGYIMYNVWDSNVNNDHNVWIPITDAAVGSLFQLRVLVALRSNANKNYNACLNFCGYHNDSLDHYKLKLDLNKSSSSNTYAMHEMYLLSFASDASDTKTMADSRLKRLSLI